MKNYQNGKEIKKQTEIKGRETTCGLVLEVDTHTLPDETRYALEQLFDFPKVFTRAEFLRQVSVIDRTFFGVSTTELKSLPVTKFEYVALIKAPSKDVRAGGGERLLVDIKRVHWEALGAVAAGEPGFNKNRRDRLLKNIEASKVYNL